LNGAEWYRENRITEQRLKEFTRQMEMERAYREIQKVAERFMGKIEKQ